VLEDLEEGGTNSGSYLRRTQEFRRHKNGSVCAEGEREMLPFLGKR
jgi:hypothetical protein